MQMFIETTLLMPTNLYILWRRFTNVGTVTSLDGLESPATQSAIEIQPKEHVEVEVDDRGQRHREVDVGDFLSIASEEWLDVNSEGASDEKKCAHSKCCKKRTCGGWTCCILKILVSLLWTIVKGLGKNDRRRKYDSAHYEWSGTQRWLQIHR